MTASHLSVVDDAPGAPAEPGTGPGATPESEQPQANPAAAPENDEIVVPPCPRLPLALLAPHPDNKREDLDLNDEFVASIREDGIRDPIEVIPLSGEPGDSADGNEDGGQRPLFTIGDGHRRYFAARLAGVEDAPVYLSPNHADDRAGQYLTMFTSSRHTSRLTPCEEADALFAAHRAGATQAVIRKRTGLPRDQVRAALKAAGLGEETRRKAKEDGYDLTIDQYALLTEFEDDVLAVEEILRDIAMGGSGQHAAERVRGWRAVKAEAAKARERYEADGFEVCDALPEGALYLERLLHDGVLLTPETHASCPGRGVVVREWDPEGAPYCSSPDTHGHVYRYAVQPAGSQDKDDSTPESGPDAPGRRLVREGNLAWAAAGKVRREFLKSLCGRATVPRDAQLFAARQILTMPANVAAKLTDARNEDLFRQLTGGITAERLDGCKPGRFPVIQLALVLTAYEVLLTSESGKACWRPTSEHRNPPVSREDAGAYFAQLAGLGYQPSTIEQAMADGVPYTGEPGLDEPASPATEA